MRKDKQKALELLKQKNNDEIKITYNEISKQTGYSRMQLSRLSKEIEKKDIDDKKQLEILIRERDERLKARASKASS